MPAAFAFSSAVAADELGLLHLAEAVEPRFPDINGIGNLVAVERKLAFEPQRVARPKATGDYAELFARLKQNLIPNARAGRLIGRNVNFEAVFGRYIQCGPSEYCDQAAERAARDPVELHRAQIGVGESSAAELHALRPLDRNLA